MKCKKCNQTEITNYKNLCMVCASQETDPLYEECKTKEAQITELRNAIGLDPLNMFFWKDAKPNQDALKDYDIVNKILEDENKTRETKIKEIKEVLKKWSFV